jgi:endonuclease/exonuclease/phosphatase family metal-dependent hydrolase
MTPFVARAMTWNIHGALGRNPRFDLQRVVDLIQRCNPDIVALQEVDSRRRGDLRRNPFSFLQEELGTHGIGAKSIASDDGDYGQMLISRWPIREIEVRDISYPEREPRRAIRAEVETPGGLLRVIATHLGLSLRERHAQAQTLLELIGAGEMATIALGDFNDWFWHGSVQGVLRRVLPGRTQHRTFPARWPMFRLDRIYCRPAGALMNSCVDIRARHVSDHLPVVADVAIKSLSFQGEGSSLALSTPSSGR